MTSSDGRVARRQKNRTAVLDAVIELFERGAVEPTVEEVAALCDVSTRSIYRYFHHRDQLIREALHHLGSRLSPHMRLQMVGSGSLDGRIERFVRNRTDIYLALAPLRRAAGGTVATTESDAAVEIDFEKGRSIMGREFLEHFAHEFNQLDGSDRDRVILGAALAFKFESLEFLHEVCAGDRAEMEWLLRRHLIVHLASPA
jgi:AcrR family transcriptional regulator